MYHILFFLSLICILIAPPADAAGTKFRYKFSAGDSWKMTQLSETETSVMGSSDKQRVRRTIIYKVTRDLGKGWHRMAAQVAAQKNWSGGQPNDQNPLKGMTFSVEIHETGSIRNYKFSGGDQTMANYIGPAMKIAIFFFPEFPDEPLQPGDDFDSVAGYKMKGMMGLGDMKTVIKTNYTLEDVDDGLAEFSSKQRMKQQGSGMKMKTAGRSEALFDLNEGMWVEHETLTKTEAGPGLGSGSTVVSRTKTELEKR
jgi:hypothetical protein